MKLIYRGIVYESESKSNTGVLNEKYADKLQVNSKLILNAIISAYNSGTKIADGDIFKLGDVLSKLNMETPAELKDLRIGYVNSNDFYYHVTDRSGLKYPLIQIPDRIRKTGTLYGRDYTGIAHELNHFYQDINGEFKKDGYGIQPNNPDHNIEGYNFGYSNNTLEINSFLHEVLIYLKENTTFANEVSGYDFGPFMEEMFEKIGKIPEKDFHTYYNDVLTDDARQQISTTLYSIWKKIKNTNMSTIK